MRIFLFFLILFFVGGFGMIYTDQMRVLLILGIVINIFMEPKLFWENLKLHKRYLLTTLLFVVYMLIHTLITINVDTNVQLHFGFMELLGFYLLGIPLYVLSTTTFMDHKILSKGLLLFCTGVLLCNSWICVELCSLHGKNLSVFNYLEYLWGSRFGGNKNILGGHVFLEAQAMSLGLSALLLFYFSCIFSDIRYKILLGLGFLLASVFVLLTVTKSALLALSFSGLILIYRLYDKITIKKRIALLSLILMFSVSIWYVLPDSFYIRMNDAERELRSLVLNEVPIDTVGNNISILPRVMIYEEVLNHIHEFGFFGLGAMTKNRIPQWFIGSPYSAYLEWLTDPHNSFIYFWILGGIIGLAYLFYLFFIPVYLMSIQKTISYLLISLLLFIFITNNTCTLMGLNDSRGIIVLFLTLFYFYFETFLLIESADTNGQFTS